MKKLLIVLCTLIIHFGVNAQDWAEYEEPICECGVFSSFDLKAKVSGFYPISSNVRKIYRDILCQVDLEASKTFCDHWQAWTNVGYLWANGRSLVFNDHTKLQLIPVSAGVNYLFPIICSLKGFIGLGASYNILKIKDDSPYVHEHVNKKSWGFIAKVGLSYCFANKLSLDLFTEYAHRHFKFKNSYSSPYVEWHNLDLSGINFGIAIGSTF